MHKLWRKIPVSLALLGWTLPIIGGGLMAGGTDHLYPTLAGDMYQADGRGNVQPFDKSKVESTTGRIHRILDLSPAGDLLVGVQERRVAPNSEEIPGTNLFVTDL